MAGSRSLLDRLPALPVPMKEDLTIEAACSSSLMATRKRETARLGMAHQVGREPTVVDRVDGGEILHWPDQGAFLVREREISHFIEDGATDVRWIEIRLFGPVLAWWATRWRRCLALHGAALAFGEEGAIGLLGAPGAGKSTLASSMIRTGSELMSDDVLLVEAAEELNVVPSFPRMKLSLAELQRLPLDPKRIEPVVPGSPKGSVPVGTTIGLGRFCPRVRPLAAVYVLERTPARVPSTRLLRGAKKIEALLQHLYLPRIYRSQGRDREMLDVLERLPVRVLRVPAGLENLAAVHRCVREDLRESLGGSGNR